MGTMAISRWDRFLCSVFPKWGIKRLESKALLRSYEAAGSGRRTSSWNKSSADADGASLSALVPLRGLSRDLRRNNSWARRGIEVITGNTVGNGIEAKAKTKDAQLAEVAIELWKDWSETTACDFDGRLDFKGLQRLAMDVLVESGEALVLKEAANVEDGLPVPLRIRILEPDFIDTRKEGLTANGARVRQGIELDGQGRRVAYWLYKQHPGATGFATGTTTFLESVRHPASDVIHLYRVDRAGQMRGVPWLCTAISRLNDFTDYEDAKLMQAKVQALFSAFVSDMDGQAKSLGPEDADDDEIETIEPGQVQYLKPGQEVTFPNPPTATLENFTADQLRAIAAGLGVTYEDLSNDYSQVNFSSARMGRLAHQINVKRWRRELVIGLLCKGVWGWVMNFAAGMNDWPSVPGSSWTSPPMPMIAPDKEIRALKEGVRSGFMTLNEAIRERGEDPVTHLQEIADTNKRLDDLEITLDSDPRHTSTSGGIQDAGGIDTEFD